MTGFTCEKSQNNNNQKYQRVSLKIKANITLVLLGVSMWQGYANTFFGQRLNSISYKTTHPPIQQIKIQGVVTDKEGFPLMGASVLEKNTTNGMSTDFNGHFSILVSTKESVLVFSYVGYESQDISVKDQSTINVKLKENHLQLEAFIAVGYGTQRKSDITGAVASLSADKIQKLPIVRADQALQGRISGVSVNNTDGAPKGSTTIRIRGSNSINGGNNPLVIIDGLQGADLSIINPSDIKSFEVLKDASATSIYGSRGSNGVIIVTTKSGLKKRKSTVNYNFFAGIQQIRRKMPLLNSSQYAETANAIREAKGLGAVFSKESLEKFKAGEGTDWQNEIFKTSLSMNHNISLSGGGDKTSYFISGNALDRRGILLGTSYNRFSLRSNIKTNISDRFTLKANTYLSREVNHTATLNTFAPGNGGSPVYAALIFSPTKPVYNADGSYSLPGGNYGPPTNYNPVALAKEPIRDDTTTMTFINLDLEYEILKGLKLTTRGAYRLRDGQYGEYLNSKPTNGATLNSATIYNGRTLFLQNTNMITYNKKLDQGHEFTITAVNEQQYEAYNDSRTGANKFLTNVSYDNLEIGANPYRPTSSRTKKYLLSYLARVNYIFKRKYFLTLTARADGSSVFGKDNKWGYFPAAALSWKVSNEDFLKDNNTITNLKLRTSYGIVGNQGISPYQSLARLNTGASFPINGTSLSTGVSLNGLPNPNLKWERTSQLNVGFDLELFKGKMNFVVDYYNKNTTDLLLSVPLPQAGGGSGTLLKNVGEVENKGLEIALNTIPIDKGDFKWENTLTWTKNNNKILYLDGDRKEIPLGGGVLPGFENSWWLEVGQPIGLIRGYQYAGVWKTNEAVEASIVKNSGKSFFPGAPKFVDQNGDNIIDGKDIVNIGNSQPDFIYGWNNTFSYKNFDLTIFIQGSYGNKIYNLGKFGTSAISGFDPTGVDALNHWTPKNENTTIPSFKGISKTEGFPIGNSSRWLEDASYLRFKNVSIGYRLSDKLVKRFKIISARVYVATTNIFTITNYTGFDPESSTNVDAYGGVDLASYPSQKTWTIGLDFKF